MMKYLRKQLVSIKIFIKGGCLVSHSAKSALDCNKIAWAVNNIVLSIVYKANYKKHALSLQILLIWA